MYSNNVSEVPVKNKTFLKRDKSISVSVSSVINCSYASSIKMYYY